MSEFCWLDELALSAFGSACPGKPLGHDGEHLRVFKYGLHRLFELASRDLLQARTNDRTEYDNSNTALENDGHGSGPHRHRKRSAQPRVRDETERPHESGGQLLDAGDGSEYRYESERLLPTIRRFVNCHGNWFILKKNMKTISATTAPARASVAATTNQPGGLAGHIQSSLATSSIAGAKPAAPAKPRIKVMLDDDHPVVRKGVSSCLARHEHLQIVAEASDGREAVAKARQLLPNVILMDIDMPHMNGLAVTELLRKELPEIKVLILSMHSNTDYVMRIIQSGARGYVLKEAPTEELVRAVDAVHSGEAFFSPEGAHAALNRFVRGVAN